MMTQRLSFLRHSPPSPSSPFFPGPTATSIFLHKHKDVVLSSASVGGSVVTVSSADGGISLPAPASPGTSSFDVITHSIIIPEKNTELEGLYKSSEGLYTTQCEAEGFRCITPFIDRPDNMSLFTVRLEAPISSCPILLSNGNESDRGVLPGGERHFSTWVDPFPKPSYLFALVAGDLVAREDSFMTRSGRKVSLKLWTKAPDVCKSGWAMASISRAMKWDEDRFGLEYDLDVFNVVAVSDFNMGAMENKSLNIFNSRLVMATPESASDVDFGRIEGVIGHEYFHNWTGNRVTCRDWFQLTLKEGLTVYRDHEFSSDLNSRPVCRIENVSILRRAQFSEDSGPMAVS
jgi:aminopeptidase N